VITARNLVCALVIPAVLGLGACARTGSHEQDERYIVDSERQWAAATVSGDVSVVERVLADDYLGVAPDGTLSDKQSEIAVTKNGHDNYVSNQAGEIKVRFYGETAIAQGSELWEVKTGEPRRGRYVWTDTWVRRKGQWQIVAAEDLIAPENTAARP
jgi:ketosteroid isomerase-like protein